MATPARSIPNDSGWSPTNCPGTMAAAARLASSLNVSLRTARRCGFDRSIITNRAHERGATATPASVPDDSGTRDGRLAGIATRRRLAPGYMRYRDAARRLGA